MRQPKFFDVKERLARLNRLGDQLDAIQRSNACKSIVRSRVEYGSADQYRLQYPPFPLPRAD